MHGPSDGDVCVYASSETGCGFRFASRRTTQEHQHHAPIACSPFPSLFPGSPSAPAQLLQSRLLPVSARPFPLPRPPFPSPCVRGCFALAGWQASHEILRQRFRFPSPGRGKIRMVSFGEVVACLFSFSFLFANNVVACLCTCLVVRWLLVLPPLFTNSVRCFGLLDISI